MTNRDRFPQISVLVNQFRSVFGDGVKVRHCTEGTESAGDPALFDRLWDKAGPLPYHKPWQTPVPRKPRSS